MSQPLIIGSVTVAVLDTVITDLTDHDKANGPSFRIVIGGFVVIVTLLILSDSQPEIADSLALLILVGTLIGPKGGALSKLIGKLTSGGTDTVAAASKGSDAVQAAIRGRNIAGGQTTIKQS